MIRKFALGLLALLILGAGVFFLFAPRWAEESMNQIDGEPLIAVSDEARAVHKTLTIVDLHSDTLLWDRDLTDRALSVDPWFLALRDAQVVRHAVTLTKYA